MSCYLPVSCWLVWAGFRSTPGFFTFVPLTSWFSFLSIVVWWENMLIGKGELDNWFILKSRVPHEPEISLFTAQFCRICRLSIILSLKDQTRWWRMWLHRQRLSGSHVATTWIEWIFWPEKIQHDNPGHIGSGWDADGLDMCCHYSLECCMFLWTHHVELQQSTIIYSWLALAGTHTCWALLLAYQCPWIL